MFTRSRSYVIIVVWHSFSTLVSINVVAQRRARLVFGWVSVRGFDLICTILVFNNAARLISCGHPPR